MPKNLRKRKKVLSKMGPKFQDANKSTKMETNTADKPRSGASNTLINLILWKTGVKMPKKPQNENQISRNSRIPKHKQKWEPKKRIFRRYISKISRNSKIATNLQKWEPILPINPEVVLQD